MKHSEILEFITKQTGKAPRQKELANVLDKPINTISARASRDLSYSYDEILKIEKYYGVHFADNISAGNDYIINLPVRGEVEASMGYGVTIYDESKTGEYSISRQLVNDLGVNKDSAEIIFGRGNSMEPTILGGDMLLIDKSKTEINDGRIYCIRLDGQLLTKRLQKLSRSKVKIISDNKEYDAIIIDFEKEIDIDFEIIGEVRWSGRVFK